MPGMRKNMKPRPKVENPKQLFVRLMKLVLKNYLVPFLLVIVCILIAAWATLQGTLFQKTLIDGYILPMLAEKSNDFAPLAAALGKLAVIYLIGVAASYAYQRIMITISQGTLRDLRKELFAHMESLPIRYFDQNAHGDIMSVYTNDIDTLRQLISQSIPQTINSMVTLVITFVSMIALSWPLTIISVFMVLVTMFVSGKLAGKSGSFFVQQQKDLGKENGYIEEMMNGQKVVKVFCHEKAAERDFDVLNEQLFRDSESAHRFANIFGPIMNNIGNLLYVLTAFAGGLLITAGQSVSNLSIQNLVTTGALIAPLSISVVASYLGMCKQFTANVSQVSQQFNAIAMAIAGAGRIFELLEQQPEADEGTDTLVNCREENGVLTECAERTGSWAWKCPRKDGSAELVPLRGDVRFFDVDFAYVPGKTVLHDISLYAKPGQKLAFVGATGAGKTTITNLINRFYDIADGKIRYDGVNINHIKKADLRHSLGIVLQDVNLFTGTVMENIRYGKLDATDEECIAAAKLANAHDFITRLPDGYDTMLTANGANLSQGQRQLLSIARAAVADPPVMILDEATSSIDTRTELLVQRGMDALMKGRTVFVIAHRLSTVQNSDAIMVLDHGRIIERGTHDDLIAQKGTYYQLYTGAFELE